MNKILGIVFNKFYIEIILATILFAFALAMDNMILIIINLLYFIIMLEIVRAVVGFLREQRVKIGILIDAFIILTLREFIVNVIKINKENITSIESLLSNSTNFNILIFSGVLIFLFMLRWAAKMTAYESKSKENKE
jgi:uncharacterized membrane protein (DUF373 family)